MNVENCLDYIRETFDVSADNFAYVENVMNYVGKHQNEGNGFDAFDAISSLLNYIVDLSAAEIVAMQRTDMPRQDFGKCRFAASYGYETIRLLSECDIDVVECKAYAYEDNVTLNTNGYEFDINVHHEYKDGVLDYSEQVLRKCLYSALKDFITCEFNETEYIANGVDKGISVAASKENILKIRDSFNRVDSLIDESLAKSSPFTKKLEEIFRQNGLYIDTVDTYKSNGKGRVNYLASYDDCGEPHGFFIETNVNDIVPFYNKLCEVCDELDENCKIFRKVPRDKLSDSEIVAVDMYYGHL